MKLACLYLVLSRFTSPSYFAGQSCVFTLLTVFYACMDKSTLRLCLDEQPNSALLSLTEISISAPYVDGFLACACNYVCM
jgi:hypothetical protein